MAADSKTRFDVAMGSHVSDAPNVRQAVPFFNVRDIEASLRFYVDGLGFTMTRQWEPDGRIRRCWSRSPCTTIQEPEGSSRQGRLSATTCGSHRSLTRMGIASTSKVLRTFPKRLFIPSRNDAQGNPCFTSLSLHRHSAA